MNRMVQAKTSFPDQTKATAVTLTVAQTRIAGTAETGLKIVSCRCSSLL